MVYSRQRKNTNKANSKSNRNKETFSLHNNNINYNNKNDINLDGPQKINTLNSFKARILVYYI